MTQDMTRQCLSDTKLQLRQRQRVVAQMQVSSNQGEKNRAECDFHIAPGVIAETPIEAATPINRMRPANPS